MSVVRREVSYPGQSGSPNAPLCSSPSTARKPSAPRRAEAAGGKSDGSCIDGAPYDVAARTPVHAAAGSGARSRSSPIGGAAYGIPLQPMTPSAICAPSTLPAFVAAT
jgi:hypothetical protein